MKSVSIEVVARPDPGLQPTWDWRLLIDGEVVATGHEVWFRRAFAAAQGAVADAALGR